MSIVKEKLQYFHIFNFTKFYITFLNGEPEFYILFQYFRYLVKS